MDNHLDWFRNCAPYIHLHREQTMVVHLSAAAQNSEYSESIFKDLALLHSLAIRLVLVFAPTTPKEQSKQGKITSDLLNKILPTVYQQKRTIEQGLIKANALTPNFSLPLRIVSGTFITARPAGVIDGEDKERLGEVRRIDEAGIKEQLKLGNVVLASPIAGSPTGDLFCLNSEGLAGKLAENLHATKLLYLDEFSPFLLNHRRVTNLSGATVKSLIKEEGAQTTSAHFNFFEYALSAIEHNVSRVHLLNSAEDGALLTELFTTDGSGLLISGNTYEQLRQANVNDASQVMALLKPLEQQGYVVERSLEFIEKEISRFTLIERDGNIIGCAALHPFASEHIGELYCLGVNPAYRANARGTELVNTIESQARSLGLKKLFLLTTQSTHWFIQHGFSVGEIEDLPVEKQAIYNYKRNSKVLIKNL